MTASSPVTLSAGALRLALRPDLGGASAGLWHGDMPVLLSQDPVAMTTNRPAGCFPLLPYSNRIAQHRFSWDGCTHELAVNVPDSPHSLHGLGWQRAWQVEAARAGEATLTLAHTPDRDWPFAFEARQHVALTPDALTITLALTNTDAQAQPVGLGLHPYFPKRANSHIALHVARRWEADATVLPTHPVAWPGIDGAVASFAFDHCFDGWDGVATIRDECFALTLTAPAQRAVVFTPATKPFFCVEPVSHTNNAIHLADPLAEGLRALAPGETATLDMTLTVRPLR